MKPIVSHLSKMWLRPCVLLPLAMLSMARADDFGALCRDRDAVERVYYRHRLGDKPPFDETLPRATLERLVRDDLRKEAVLKTSYGLEVTPTMLDAEIQRINATSRAPEILAELKAALHEDASRFARTVVKPVIVERLLRQKFENDDALHGATRLVCETVRAGLLAAKANGGSTEQLLAQLKRAGSNAVTDTTWQLSPRPVEKKVTDAGEVEVKKRVGSEAQSISSVPEERARKHYFEDLPADLQRVLRLQLRQSGDISAVIEMPSGFRLYILKERTAEWLGISSLVIAKRSYEEWLSSHH